MIYGYARVSTDDQDLSLQLDALQAEKVARIFQDKISGTKAAREGLDAMLTFLKRGDKVVVYKLDRLGRSVQHLVNLMRWFEDNGIEFKSLRESIDTATSTGRLMFNMLASLAQFERDIISERTKAGLAARVKRGVKLGRPITKQKQIQLAIAMHKQGKSLGKIAKRCGLAVSYVWKITKQERK